MISELVKKVRSTGSFEIEDTLGRTLDETRARIEYSTLKSLAD
jgi:hypothetical protein